MATIPSRKATFTEEEKRKLVEGTDAQGKPLSESEKMKLSKMHTARTLGADWRERAAERSKAEESARAQQALEERAAINRRMQGSQLPSPLQKDVSKTEVDLPSGGKVKFGIDTLARMRGFEEDQAAQNQASEQERRKKAIAYSEERKGALRKRYEDELASRGFAPPKTRQEAEAISRAKTEEFKLARQSREDADLAEKTALRDYSNFKQAAIQAKRDKDYGTASYYENEAAKINELVGGNIRNATARKSFFQDQASKDLMREVNARSEARKEKIKKETISNPEASSFTPKSTGAPLTVGSDMPSYQLPYQKPAGPTEQPFGMTTPAMVDSGVDFSRISPYNAAETRITETTSETARPTTRSIMPATKTSKQQTIEDVLPGASNMPVVQRNPKETAAQHNARVMQEYEKNVIIPSFDKQTQDALISATELNRQKDQLFSQRFTSPERSKQYKDVSEKASKQQDVLKKSIDKLRAEKRNMAKYPMNSKERQFIDLQIATLQNQLGFIAKRLY